MSEDYGSAFRELLQYSDLNSSELHGARRILKSDRAFSVSVMFHVNSADSVESQHEP